ncbi:hypothetical protein BDV29DRAFT_154893 [Aspergillus leporis]|jgi:hypothetical protein|uniref:DUF7703 domain-containing protein n=1 Tax=Aspergillus leporis TaxID=41062 RepID=A0A5N5X9S0_9EURO|nr:hypothetical protein BDV29DRAFT_154893 [Aspergillus leporis]
MAGHDIVNTGSNDPFRGGPGAEFAIECVVATFIGIAWYNSLELVVLCFTTFKRYGGCYFWSLVIASVSIVPFALGYFLLIFDIFSNYFSVAIEVIGWWGMVTGQSMVLWSRLHLVVHSRRVLRYTLAMIIINAILFHTPASVLEFGTHSHHADKFVPAFDIFERIQLVAFSVQEIVLSVIYAWAAIEMLKLMPRGHYKGILIHLLIINFLMICMDATVVGVQYAGFFKIHVSVKAMVYSVKLKMEYAILGKLVHMSAVPVLSGYTPSDESPSLDRTAHTHPVHAPPNEDNLANIIHNGTNGAGSPALSTTRSFKEFSSELEYDVSGDRTHNACVSPTNG